MIVDNFDLIKPLLKFDNNKLIIQVQVLQRRKDASTNSKGSNRNRTIRSYHFYSMKQFEEKIDEIKGLCNYFNARAYININPKGLLEIMWKLNLMTIETIKCIANSNTIVGLHGIVDSAIAQVSAKKEYDTWMVDVDDLSQKEAMIEEINKAKSGFDKNFIIEIPTVSGCHLITHRFDARQFTQKFPNTLKKNSATLLYCNLGEEE